MYVKVFSQILESSIAVDYEQRHVFEDMLKLADREGVVDMTHEAIARRVNVPEPIIRKGISKLEEPDPLSRSEEYEGRRIIRLANHREWGWQIVNYVFYRDLIDAEALRAANRERKREQRARERARHEMSQSVRDKSQESQNVTLSESEAFSDTKTNKPKNGANGSPPLTLESLLSELKEIYPHVDLEVEKAKIRGWMLSNPGKRKLTKRFVVNWLNRVDRPLENGSSVTTIQQFVTREMIDDWCERKGYSKLAPIARGKLISGKLYGTPITNTQDFKDAMAALLNDWLKTP